MSPSAYRRLILGGPIVGLAGWLVIPRLLGHSGPQPARAAEGEVMPAEQTVAELALPTLPDTESSLWVRDGAAPAPWPENPFQRPRQPAPATEDASTARAPAQPAAFVLHAVISGDVPRALINDRILAVGDTLSDGSTIVTIDTLSVTLSGPEGTWTLELAQ
jgi:hypothetical protein